MKTVTLCVFNRATYSRCKYVIQELHESPEINLVVIVGGSLLDDSYGKGLSYIEYENPDVKIHKLKDMQWEKTGHGIVLEAAHIQTQVADALEEFSPDLNIVVADRYETIAAATASSYMNIPTAHIQGGEITGNIDDKVRNAVTKLSDYHFVATDLARKYLVQMGEGKRRVMRSGCPSIDVPFYNAIKRWFPKRKYIMVMWHPVTTETNAYEQTQALSEAVVEFAMKRGCAVEWYIPNPDPGRAEIVRYMRKMRSQHHIFMTEAVNEPPVDFLEKLAGARLIVGNSSVGIRETGWIGVPSVNVGERQNLRERTHNVIDVPAEKDQLDWAMQTQWEARRYKRMYLYGSGGSAKFIREKIENLEPTLKGGLTYPHWPEYVNFHLGDRFAKHKSLKQVRRAK